MWVWIKEYNIKYFQDLQKNLMRWPYTICSQLIVTKSIYIYILVENTKVSISIKAQKPQKWLEYLFPWTLNIIVILGSKWQLKIGPEFEHLKKTIAQFIFC